MDGTAVVFLAVGGIGLVVLVLSLVVGELDLGFGDVDADGFGSLGRSVAATVAQGLQLSGDLTGIDVAALLRRLSCPAGTGVIDGVTHVPISSDGDGPKGNGSPA